MESVPYRESQRLSTGRNLTISRLEVGTRLRTGTEEPLDWPFVAMAHRRLGHPDEARRWLDRLCDRQSNPDGSQFWEELEIRLLHSEAEVLILCGPVFPDQAVHALSSRSHRIFGVTSGSRYSQAKNLAKPPHNLPGRFVRHNALTADISRRDSFGERSWFVVD